MDGRLLEIKSKILNLEWYIEEGNINDKFVFRLLQYWLEKNDSRTIRRVYRKIREDINIMEKKKL